MLNFQPVTMADRPWIHEILYAAGRPGCEYSFANLLFWGNRWGGVCRFGDFLLKEAVYGSGHAYFYPAGQGDVKDAIEALREDAEGKGHSLCLRGVTDTDRMALERLYPGKFSFTANRDAFDYLYPIEKLCTLTGKKLQSKRNHINRFLADNGDWHTEVMTAKTAKTCLSLMEAWYENHHDHKALHNERAALETAIEHFDLMGFDGLLLYAGKRLVAFSMGNRLNETYFDVNFEKAYADVQGAYPLINREFARHIADKYPEVRFLNREDDMGLEGLRKAKESYNPDLLVKYKATWEG